MSINNRDPDRFTDELGVVEFVPSYAGPYLGACCSPRVGQPCFTFKCSCGFPLSHNTLSQNDGFDMACAMCHRMWSMAVHRSDSGRWHAEIVQARMVSTAVSQ